MNSETAIAYCAGLFDGEGCVTISRQMREAHQQSGGIRLQLRLVMTDERGVRSFRELIRCGTVRYQPARDEIRRPSWVWTLCSPPLAAPVLRAMRPYLVVKAREVDIALRLLQTTAIPERTRLWQASRACKSKGRGHAVPRVA